MNIKKYLPFILLGVGVLVLIGVFIVLRNKKTDVSLESGEEAGMLEVPLEKRPIVALVPDEVGHYLKLKIEKIDIQGAKTMDYELIYEVPDGPSQGVPGSVEIAGQSSFNADLLLGSESSGKFRYDEGVQSGAVTLRFRNESGKLITKFSSDFHMQRGESMLTSQDGLFSFELDRSGNGFFITMSSIGVPKAFTGKAGSEPYIVNSSIGEDFGGTVSIKGMKVYHFENGDWKELKDGASKSLGSFIGM